METEDIKMENMRLKCGLARVLLEVIKIMPSQSHVHNILDEAGVSVKIGVYGKTIIIGRLPNPIEIDPNK